MHAMQGSQPNVRLSEIATQAKANDAKRRISLGELGTLEQLDVALDRMIDQNTGGNHARRGTSPPAGY